MNGEVMRPVRGLHAAACLLCPKMQIRLSKRHLPSWTLIIVPKVLAKVSLPPRLWQLTMSSPWATWCASQGRMMCA